MTIDPRFMTIEYWSAQVSQSLLQIGPGGGSTDEKNWRDWAQKVRQLPQLGSANIPEPTLFNTWQDWAFRFNEAVSPLGL